MKNLKFLRKSRHLSQSELSRLLHISQQSICKYESGHSEATETLLIKTADFFDTSVDFLLGLSNSPLKCDTVRFPSSACISPEEAIHINLYRHASREQREAVDTLLKSCLCTNTNQEN